MRIDRFSYRQGLFFVSFFVLVSYIVCFVIIIQLPLRYLKKHIKLARRRRGSFVHTENRQLRVGEQDGSTTLVPRWDCHSMR
jgi:hypothetical protein